MKRILCLIDSLASGGAERQMSYLSSGLKNYGHEVKLVVFSEFSEFYREYTEKHGVLVETCLNGKNKIKRIFVIINLIRKYKPDAVITYKDGVNIAACLARLFIKYKLIVSERNTTQILSRYDRAKFFLYRVADIIVPNSFSQANFIQQNYKSLSKKVRLITNAIDHKTFQEGSSIFDEAAPIVLTTARVMPQKNVLLYLEAISKINKVKPELRFLWVGNNHSSYFEQVRNHIKDLGLSGVIEFRDAEKNIEEIYQRANFFCLPSVYEGFPNVICEAMACGLPVACSNVCDNAYIVQNGINGILFDPMNVDDIVDKIITLTELPSNDLKKMSVKNISRIADLCSLEKFIESYNSLI